MKKKFRFRKGSFIKIGKRPVNFTFRGERGRIPRIILALTAAILIIALVFLFSRPEKQLMETPEARRVLERGALTAGALSDMPPFAYEGKGFETELAERFAEFLFAGKSGGAALKQVTISSKTADARLSDGSVDVVIALMQRGVSVKYAYSCPYYTDECRMLVLPGSETAPLTGMLIGFVQQTASERILKAYVNERETRVNAGILDKIKRKKTELPPDAVKFNLKAFASYPDILNALHTGRIDGAVMSGAYLLKYKEETDRYGFVPHKEIIGSIEYAITARADEPALARLADMFIYDMRKNGELEALLTKYGLE